jgi:hypothetical protein
VLVVVVVVLGVPVAVVDVVEVVVVRHRFVSAVDAVHVVRVFRVVVPVRVRFAAAHVVDPAPSQPEVLRRVLRRVGQPGQVDVGSAAMRVSEPVTTALINRSPRLRQRGTGPNTCGAWPSAYRVPTDNKRSTMQEEFS